jgi:hypothetical protein
MASPKTALTPLEELLVRSHAKYTIIRKILRTLDECDKILRGQWKMSINL